MHLLVRLVPEVCRRFPYVHFIIGGDGPKRAALEEMRERHHLQVITLYAPTHPCLCLCEIFHGEDGLAVVAGVSPYSFCYFYGSSFGLRPTL